MTALSQLSAPAATSGGGAPVVTERTLAAFDAASRPRAIDDALLDPDSAGVLAEALSALVVEVKGADLEGLAASRGWRQRLFGADLESRLLFAVQVKLAREARLKLQGAAAQAERLLTRLRAAAGEARSDHARLSQVAAKADRLIAVLSEGDDGAGADLLTRFRRRRANLATTIASVAVAQAQLEAAADYQSELLERAADVEVLLFPVWERRVLAVAQAQTDPEQVSAARHAARELVERLMGEGLAA